MIQHEPERVVLSHDNRLWQATHCPQRLSGGNQVVLPGGDVVACDGGVRVDDLPPASAVLDRFRAYHRGGSAVVESEGFYPFGNELRLSQSWRYAGNHVRITHDLNWPRDTRVDRHLSLGDVLLPGRWKRFYLLPPALHLAEGVNPGWRDIPADTPPGTMIGHWHRPPLAIVCERDNGTRLEIGTGSDLWRWEQSLGAGPESGSYKLIVEADGLRFVREPLMCCLPFTPNRQIYRFKWYMAWWSPAFPAGRQLPAAERIRLDDQRRAILDLPAGQPPALLLDLSALPCPLTARRLPTRPDFIRGIAAGTPCWESAAAQKVARAIIRQIAALPTPGILRIKGLLPQPCHTPAHVDRKAENGIVHWDVTSILELSVWMRRQLADGWTMQAENRLAEILPSIQGIGLANGFAVHHDQPGADE